MGRFRAIAAATVACALLAAAAPAAGQEPLPPQGVAPAGTNDFGCKPPARHPYPVVLVHGTFLNMELSWGSVAPALTRLGYCVFALDYGNNATGDIPTSARQLKTFVDEVLSRTGATKVSLVGHSQGGMMPRYWMKNLGGAGKVDDLVGFSPSNHGTTNPGAGPLGPTCVACTQQAAGSEFITALNAGDQTPGDASFTVVQTRNDEVVTPFESAFLPAGGAVTNVLVQDKCASDAAEHITIPYDPVAIQWMLDALGHPGPANPAYAPDCSGQRVNTFPDSSSAAPGGGSGGGGTTRMSLALGHVPRSASTTRHRRLRVAAKAKGATLRRVVVSVRSTRGKVLGRSSAVTLTKRRRAIVVKLRRALRPGRYVIVAQGREAASGRSIGASRTIRLR